MFKPLRQLTKALKQGSELPAMVLTSLVMTVCLLGVRQLGWLQPLELAAYDQMTRWQPDQPTDPRILIVGITESDIQDVLKRWPPSDEIIAQVLAEINRHQPSAIGLDLVRDIPYEPGHQALVKQLQNPRLYAVTFISPNRAENVAPPPTVPKERQGFSNLYSDPDSVVRRQALYISDGTTIYTSFSLQVAQAYLADRNIQPDFTPEGALQLGNTVFPKLDARSGNYQTVDTAGYQLLLRYRARQKAIREVSFQQVLQGELDPAWVKDKIVLVGAVGPSTKDYFYTPYSADAKTQRMMGIVIHAQIVSQILSSILGDSAATLLPVGQPPSTLFRFWPEGLEMLWIWIWSLAGSLLAWRLRHPISFGLGILVAMASLAGISFGIFSAQVWIPTATPMLALVLTGGAIVSYQQSQALQQQQMVMKLLGQQTSPEVAEQFWQARDRLLDSGLLPGETVTATILFSDIRGFSSISEQRDSAEVMRWLNEYFQAMTEEVTHHGGIVNKFLGDGLMAVFGVPIPRTREAEIALDAQHAVQCAVAMCQALPALNQTWQEQGLPTIQIRVGIFTGPVTVGSLGGKARLEYGVIGDSVNVASRLESCEKDRQTYGCRILIAQETRQYLVGENFQLESWGSLPLRGRQELTQVYRVILPS